LAVFGADFGSYYVADFELATGAVGSHEGLKQRKVEKPTELPHLFEVGKKIIGSPKC
jgi:hypothetical protein